MDFVINYEQIIDEDKKYGHFALFIEGDPIIYKEVLYDEKW